MKMVKNMYNTSKERADALRKGKDIVYIEQIYIQSNCMKIVRPNILKTRE